MEKFAIEVYSEYSRTPGGRWKKLGGDSGEEFYENCLLPKYLSAKESNDKLHVYLDSVRSYPNSFLDQSFGELARKYGVEDVKNRLVFHTESFKWIVVYINDEIWGKF